MTMTMEGVAVSTRLLLRGWRLTLETATIRNTGSQPLIFAVRVISTLRPYPKLCRACGGMLMVNVGQCCFVNVTRGMRRLRRSRPFLPQAQDPKDPKDPVCPSSQHGLLRKCQVPKCKTVRVAECGLQLPHPSQVSHQQSIRSTPLPTQH
jgi:hypothetical protein